MRAGMAGVVIVAALGQGAGLRADDKPLKNTAPAAGAAAPRKPGVYPILVVSSSSDEVSEHAYVLGCAKVTKSGSKLLGAKDCTSLIRGAKLELVQYDGTRSAVRATQKTGIGNPCFSLDRRERWVQLTGLGESPHGLVVSVGVAETKADPKTEPAIEKTYPKSPGKAPGDDGWDIVAAFDLDGDGHAEVVTSFLGEYILWSADGKKVGSVGCAEG